MKGPSSDDFTRDVLAVPLLEVRGEDGKPDEKWAVVDSKVEAEGQPKKEASPAMLRYALLYINFIFVMAAVILTTTGMVIRTNPPLKLCSRCQNLATISLVGGVILWLMAMNAFLCFRSRNILFLLIYGSFIVILAIGTVTLIIFAAFFSGKRTWQEPTSFEYLAEWKSLVGQENATHEICEIQRLGNCSGYHYGCCVPYSASHPNRASCYGGPPNFNIPGWVEQVCPKRCSAGPVPTVCTNQVLNAVPRMYAGFIFCQLLTFALVLCGLWLANLVPTFYIYQ